MERLSEFDRLAALLRYPGEGYQHAAERCMEALSKSGPEAALLVVEFLERTQDCSIEELQALYTATFDLDPACSLEVGWHLFGENYERGEFLVKMRVELRRLGLSESTELPDHLTHALGVLARMEPEEAEEFATACLFPALDKMCAALQGQSNPFENVMLAVARVLERRYPRPAPEAVPAGAAFRILDSGGW